MARYEKDEDLIMIKDSIRQMDLKKGMKVKFDEGLSTDNIIGVRNHEGLRWTQWVNSDEVRSVNDIENEKRIKIWQSLKKIKN